MNDPIRPAVEVAAEICGCASISQRKIDTAVIEAKFGGGDA